MDTYLILSQAVAVLKVMLKRVDSNLTYLERNVNMQKDERIRIQNQLLSDKEDILQCLKYAEGIVDALRENLTFDI